jgi:hypothetical protein
MSIQHMLPSVKNFIAPVSEDAHHAMVITYLANDKSIGRVCDRLVGEITVCGYIEGMLRFSVVLESMKKEINAFIVKCGKNPAVYYPTFVGKARELLNTEALHISKWIEVNRHQINMHSDKMSAHLEKWVIEIVLASVYTACKTLQ